MIRGFVHGDVGRDLRPRPGPADGDSGASTDMRRPRPTIPCMSKPRRPSWLAEVEDEDGYRWGGHHCLLSDWAFSPPRLDDRAWKRSDLKTLNESPDPDRSAILAQ